jgi:hypothetical protein
MMNIASIGLALDVLCALVVNWKPNLHGHHKMSTILTWTASAESRNAGPNSRVSGRHFEWHRLLRATDLAIDPCRYFHFEIGCMAQL